MIAILTIPKPNRVLSPVKYFINRNDEIKILVDTLKGVEDNIAPEKICVVRGNPGTGKTEICLEVVHRLSQEYSDAQIYLKLDEKDSHDISIFTIFETIIHIIDPYAQIPSDLNALQNQYSTILEGKKVLIVLDDLQIEEHIETLIPPSSCALLVTTDKSTKIENVHSISLDELSQENSEILLLKSCSRIDNNVERLAIICQNNPLNLCLVSGCLNYDPTINVDDFIVELEGHIIRSTEPEETLTDKILAYIFKQFNVTERNLFSQLSIFSNGFHKELAEQTFNADKENDTDYETIEGYLDAFTQLNLLTYNEENQYYRIQPTVQRFVEKQFGHAPEVWYRLGKALAASIGWYNSFAQGSADEYLLSLLLLDEYKSTIKNVLGYLLNHASTERDQILLAFYDLIRFSGKSRFSPRFELVPLLEAMVSACIRLKDFDKLKTLLDDLSKDLQMLGEDKKALYYSKLLEDITGGGLTESVKKTLEVISQDMQEDEHVSETDVTTPSKLVLSEIENLLINRTKIVLTGFMGTGKTTVGKLLAENLNYRFIDTDEFIEARNGRSIAEIFQDLGEDAFREMERALVKEIAELDSVVISTGGRLMLDPENVRALSRNSRVLCLVATPDEILTRVTYDKLHPRPLLSVPNPKERIVELLQERNDRYLRFPQIVTDEKKPKDIANSLVEFVNTSPKSLIVENPHKNYEYIVGAGLLPFIRQLTSIDGEIAIITDEIVKELYGPSCSSIDHIIEIPSGRQNKSLAIVESVYDRLLEIGFDRTGTILSLGGSVIGDIGGYVAATYMRGVNFVQCPTSLIAMVDTSVGGKTGIDLPQGKNIIGLYKQPIKVIADVATLQTLPHPDFTSGMAEIIKHGLIAESSLLDQVEQGHWARNWDRSPSYIGELQRLVAQAIQVKINIVQADPFEQGQRSILNLGHTFAYAIEQVSNDAYRHGEAVSIGLVAAAKLSVKLGYCDISLQERIESILESVNLPTRIPSNLEPINLLQAMQRDKKKRAGQLRFILIRGIGQVFVSDNVLDQDVLDILSSLSE